MKRFATIAFLVVVGVSGCGKSKSSSSAKDNPVVTTTTTTAPRLAKADFIAKADPICVRVTSETNAVPEPKSASELEPALKKIVAIVEPGLAELRALNAEPADAAVFKEHFLDPNQAQLDAAKKLLADLPSANGDEAKIEALAEKWQNETSALDDATEGHDAALKAYGFVGCAKTNE